MTDQIDAVVIDAVVVETEVVDVLKAMESVPSTSTSEEFESTFREVEGFLKGFKAAVSKLRQLKREIVSIEKNLNKHEERRARRKMAAYDENGNKRKNGFSLENNLISDELSDFICYEKGKPISRSEVTRRLTAYVKEHVLQDQADKRYVNLDTDAGIKLKDLLSEVLDKEGNPARLTIITMNKFVNKHYVGKVEPPKDATETTDVATTEAKVETTEVEVTSTEEKMAASKEEPLRRKKILKKKISAVPV
jgi:chromatin remodeling complex protein RSC6